MSEWSLLRARRHHNWRLQVAFDECGEAVFEWAVVLVCDPAECRQREQQFVNRLGPGDYNICRQCVDSPLHIRRTEEFKQKISANNGMHSLATRMKSAASLRGQRRSAETRATMRKVHSGRPHPHRGCPASPETREKLSAHSGMHNPEARARVSAGLRAYWARRRCSVTMR